MSFWQGMLWGAVGAVIYETVAVLAGWIRKPLWQCGRKAYSEDQRLDLFLRSELCDHGLSIVFAREGKTIKVALLRYGVSQGFGEGDNVRSGLSSAMDDLQLQDDAKPSLNGVKS